LAGSFVASTRADALLFPSGDNTRHNAYIQDVKVQPARIDSPESGSGVTFQEYMGRTRPLLDKAFEESLCAILDGAIVKDRVDLASVLGAGKKIRGSLTCLVGQALGAGLESTIPRATAIELIQTATLIHDDFVDQDTVRRNRPAVWTTEGARKAVLIGDVIFSTAVRMASDLGRDEGRAVSFAIAETSRGALHEPLDVSDIMSLIRSNRFDDKAYETIIRLKTAILFAAACELGSIAAGSDSRTREAFYRYGLLMGEAYQIADDVKEVKKGISNGSMETKQFVTLVPALLRFATGPNSSIPRFLGAEHVVLSRDVLRCMTAAADFMESEIDLRTQMAVSEVSWIPRRNLFFELALTAPHDTIAALLNEV
jgi:hypothetical protein